LLPCRHKLQCDTLSPKTKTKKSPHKAFTLHASHAARFSTDIRFFDDTVYELLDIAANTLLTGDEMYRFSFFS